MISGEIAIDPYAASNLPYLINLIVSRSHLSDQRYITLLHPLGLSKRFIQQLPALHENRHRQESVLPNRDRFDSILARVPNWTTVNILQLLNVAVSCMEPGEVYCEIGCFQGASLIGALLDRPSVMAYAVDNFAEFDPFGDRLMENISRFGLSEQVFFCQQVVQEFFSDLRSLSTEDKISAACILL